MNSNYFFIDGSSLTAQIRSLWREEQTFKDRRLCPIRFTSYFMSALPHLHANSYKRVTFYFPRGGDEAAITRFILMPDIKKPGEVRDVHFTFCGEKLKKSAEFDQWVEENVPSKFTDRFYKSEKGVDVQICCDALKLASAGRIDRLFLLSNDSDFIPFARAIKEFGSNISLFHLFDSGKPNLDLLQEVDSYDVVPHEILETIFEASADASSAEVDLNGTEDVAARDPADLEKPCAAPSDLGSAEAGIEDHIGNQGTSPLSGSERKRDPRP